MKQLSVILLGVSFFIKTYSELSNPNINIPNINNSNLTNSDASKIFYSSPLTLNNQKPIKNLLSTTPSYLTLGIINNGQELYQGIQNRKTKTAIPQKIQPLLKTSKLSLFKTIPDAFKNYPSGEKLFKNYPDVAQKFNAMINGFVTNPKFIPLFRKVHINILNELYSHLMGIFMNFNLHHPGIIQNQEGDLQVNVSEFITSEKMYDMNKKTMIINHLIGIIESQFNSAIRSYAHHMPQSFATYIGKIAIHNDYSTDLTRLILEEIEPELKNLQISSLQALANYVEFFQLMTSYLNKKSKIQNPQFSGFVDIAQGVNEFLYADKNANQSIIAQMKNKAPSAYLSQDLNIAQERFAPKLKNTISPLDKISKEQLQSKSQLFSDDSYLIALSKMNPPILNFRYDDLRAIKVIPYLAQKLSPNSKNISWPAHIVEAANEGLLLNSGDKSHPIAYFKTKENEIVKNFSNDTSSDLFICMRLGDNLFEQILIAQPDWLNSWDGIFKIMRACYGDFTAIVGMGILDPVMESLVANVKQIQEGKAIINSGVVYQNAQNLIQSWKNKYKNSSSALASQEVVNNVPSLPKLPSLSFPNETPSLLAQP